MVTLRPKRDLGPTLSSPKNLLILSALAIGCSLDGPYKTEPDLKYFIAIVLRLDPTNPLGHDLLGRVARRHKLFADAETQFALEVRYARGDLKMSAQRNLDVATALQRGEGG